jgi:hypothetical protein
MRGMLRVTNTREDIGPEPQIKSFQVLWCISSVVIWKAPVSGTPGSYEGPPYRDRRQLAPVTAAFKAPVHQGEKAHSFWESGFIARGPRPAPGPSGHSAEEVESSASFLENLCLSGTRLRACSAVLA